MAGVNQNVSKMGTFFEKYVPHFMPIFEKNLIRYVLWNVSNFALIFYVMSVLHKKSRQSLRPSTGRIG